MKIEEGKYYRRRYGKVVGPAKSRDDSEYPWQVGDATYTENGQFFSSCHPSIYDLIEECTPDGAPVSQCNPDGTPVTSEPIMDNRTLLEKAMREGLPVKSSESFDSYTVTAIGNYYFLGVTNGGLGNEVRLRINTEGGWQIVEPAITAEDLCKAIDDFYSSATGFGSLSESYLRAKAKELADNYRKQQEKRE